MEGKQRVRRKSQKLRKLYISAFALLLFVIIGSGFSIVGYRSYTTNYQRYMALGRAGLQHLRTGATLLEALQKNPLDAHPVNSAQKEFVAAQNMFSEIHAGLQIFPGVSTAVPVYGARLSTALHLVTLGLGISQAGVASCGILSMLISRFHDPLNAQGKGLSMADFSTIVQNFNQIKLGLSTAMLDANQIDLGGLQIDPHLVKSFATFNKDFPSFLSWLNDGEKVLATLPVLLGVSKPANYLIEVLDSTELRPTGGFIGNYGIATLAGGRLTAAHITDVDLIDRPFKATGKRIPYPSTYAWFRNYLAPEGWSLRDSNLDADFPTAARYGELNYQREGGDVPVQGVIAITPELIQNGIALTGPIYVPEYNETINAQNLIERIHYHQLGPAGEGSDSVPSPDGHSSLRKRFTALLAEHFLDRIHKLPSSVLPKFVLMLMNALHAKDIQIYLNDNAAEHVLQQLHLDAGIQPLANDGLFVVDTNVAGDKANSFISSTIHDQVTIDTTGNAVHQTTLSYAWLMDGNIYGRALYRDYLRIYAPSSSILQSQTGWEPHGTSQAFGREVWAGYFTLLFGQTRTMTFKWIMPHAAQKDDRTWHYNYMIQRQAGTQRILQLQVTLPSCATVFSTSGGLVSKNRRGAAAIQTLNEDVNEGMSYSC